MLEVLAGVDCYHPGPRFGLRYVDRPDIGMRVGAPEDRGVEHAGELDVLDVLGAAGEQARVLNALQGVADVAGHQVPPDIAAAAALTALTMFT